MDQQTYDELNNNPVPIRKIDPQTTTRKLILQGFPLNFSMRAILAHAQVAEATRCNINGTPTKQVLITLRGPILTYLNLKTWGTYSIRPYTPEPLRCYNCQKFGHHQSWCTQSPICGVCSGKRSSQQCIDKLKAKQTFIPKCANCYNKHHAWDKHCPTRKTKIQLDRDRERRNGERKHMVENRGSNKTEQFPKFIKNQTRRDSNGTKSTTKWYYGF